MNKLEDMLDNFWNTHKSNAGVAYLYGHKLIIAWIVCVILAVALGYIYQGKVSTFQGIAEATETIISVPSPTEVVKVHVIPGQKIQPGDTIVELNRPDLTLRISEVTRELDVIEGRSTVSAADIDQKVAAVKAELSTRTLTLKSEIRRLESEYQKNREIASKLKSLKGTNTESDGTDAMAMQIKGLKNELAVATANANEQIKLLRSSNRIQKNAGAAEVENLKKELDELKKQQEDLIQVAKENWVVGSVNVHNGEKVSSFAPIVTLTHKSPTLIRGYIHEKMYQRMDVGETVKVRSLSGSGRTVKGKVEGLSSRIVEFPMRMWKMPEMPVHGREVIITIPADNDFLLGEMVTISE